MSNINVKLLYAGMGDSIILSFKVSSEKVAYILIDGGNNFTAYTEHLKKEIEDISDAGHLIDVAVITHIDQDHIKGIIYLSRDLKSIGWRINEDNIVKYWFNSSKSIKITDEVNQHFDISVAEMRELEKFLHSQPDSKWAIKDKIFSPQVLDCYGAKLSILSPPEAILKESENEFGKYDIGELSDDYDLSLEYLIKIEEQRVKLAKEELDVKFENKTSIAFLFEYEKKAILCLGDAIPEVIDAALRDILNSRQLKRLVVDVVKLSHHGSRKSISWNFLELIECTTFLISTNGNKAKLPNKATFAKILGHSYRDRTKKILFKFNYPDFDKRLKFTEEEKDLYNFDTENSNYEHGYLLPL